jgi:hypothetical protein
MDENKRPGRAEILGRMWQLANAEAADAVRLACVPEEDWDGLKMNLDAVTEFSRKSNGSFEMKFADRTKLLERLLDETKADGGQTAPDGAEQVENFLKGLEEKGK